MGCRGLAPGAPSDPCQP